MDVTYTHCAGLDVHKKTVVVCCLTPGTQGESCKEIRSFGTMTADLLQLLDWLKSQQVTHLAMESTGEFWKPLYNLLEGQFQILVVNAKHIKNVPGRKTDVKDAEWIADLLRHGLLRGSYIPAQAQRDLRDLTRQRTNLVEDRATVVNRLQKVLEWANIKLSSVATNVTGVSARAMLEAIVSGQVDAVELAELAKGRLRKKQAELERALTGHVREHHRFMIAQHFMQIDFLDEQIASYDAEIAKHLQQQTQPTVDPSNPAQSSGEEVSKASREAQTPLTWESAVALLDTIPGVGSRTAELLLSEIGLDMSRFPSAAHLASWAKLSPGNNESAGKRYSGKTGKGNRWLRSGIVQAAHAAVRVKTSYLSTVYHHLAGRRGAPRAIIAVAHHMLTAVYYMLTRNQPFRDLGANYRDERNKARVVKRLTNRLRQLGVEAIFQPIATSPSQASEAGFSG